MAEQIRLHSFRKEVAQTRKAMDALNKKKMNVRLNATQAMEFKDVYLADSILQCR